MHLVAAGQLFFFFFVSLNLSGLSYLRHCQAPLRAPALGTSGSPVQSQRCEVVRSAQRITAEEWSWGGRPQSACQCSLRWWREGGERERVIKVAQPGRVSCGLVSFSLYASELQKIIHKRERKNRCKQ